jgi:RNA polymerase sigma factor (sigma-70 family)
LSAKAADLRFLPEQALVLAAQAGNEAAFAEIVRRRQAWVRTLLRRLCGDRSEADDLAQEAFLRAWQGLSGLRESLAFGGWLRQLTLRVFVDARRRKGIDLAALASSEGPAVEEDAPDLAAGVRVDLERAFALLSSAERACIVLNLGEGLSHAEIEQLLPMPLGTIKSSIMRGTAKLRRLLGDYDD